MEREGRARQVQFYFDGSRSADSSVAMAKLEMVTPRQVIVDYRALLKVDGEWVIVNKIFDRVPRS